MPKDANPPPIEVAKLGGGHSLSLGGLTVPCLVGQAGIIGADSKQEGDGATPAGVWRLREVLYRPDRVTLPRTALPEGTIGEQDGWCDDPAETAYNRRVTLPFAGSHEQLWREDSAYDVLIPLGYNDDPPVPGRGSAIFLHCIGENRKFTEGCVAIAPESMINLLPILEAGAAIRITG